MRAPVRYGISTTAPTMISGPSEAVPYRLINFNPTAGVVWLSDNAGIQIGEGTPLNPGTSFLWERPGVLFAIAESPTTIILTTELSDWQPDPSAVAIAILNSGVLLIDQPEVLYSDTLDAGNGFLSGVIDIARYQSATVFLICSALSGGNEDAARINFYSDADDPLSVISYRVIQFTAAGSANGGSTWLANIPLQGAGMQLLSPTLSTIAVIIVGSNRPQETVDQTIVNADTAQLDTNLEADTFTLLTAGTRTSILNPWMGELEIDLNLSSATAMATSGLLVVRRNPATGLYDQIIKHVVPTLVSGTAYQASLRVACAGDALQTLIVNASGSTWTNAVLRVTPVTGLNAGV